MTNWETEFREYFDKMLKPKKPSMSGLDRELCIDFIRKNIAQAVIVREDELRAKIAAMLPVADVDIRKGAWLIEQEKVLSLLNTPHN